MAKKPDAQRVRGPKRVRRRKSPGVIAVRERARRGTGFIVAKWRVASTLAPSFDAVLLVKHVSDAVLEAHFDAIVHGRLATESGQQQALSSLGRQGQRAADGERPNIRGVTGIGDRSFPSSITRSKIRLLRRPKVLRPGITGTRAVCTIGPDPQHENFVKKEAERGVQYFFVTGFIADVVSESVKQWLEASVKDATAEPETKPRRAVGQRRRR